MCFLVFFCIIQSEWTEKEGKCNILRLLIDHVSIYLFKSGKYYSLRIIIFIDVHISVFKVRPLSFSFSYCFVSFFGAKTCRKRNDVKLTIKNELNILITISIFVLTRNILIFSTLQWFFFILKFLYLKHFVSNIELLIFLFLYLLTTLKHRFGKFFYFCIHISITIFFILALISIIDCNVSIL